MKLTHYSRILLIACCLMTVRMTAQQTQYNDGRLLDELNTVGTADAYPWISPDGLRVYYTKEVAGQNKTYRADRPSLLAEFANATDLFPSFTDPQYAPWLSADELEIWFESYGKLMHATRASIVAPFGTLEEIVLSPDITGFKSPTLTPDGEELYIYDLGITRRYERTGSTYTEAGTLEIGLTNMKTFKLDGSGLAGYTAMELNDVHYLFRTTRASLNDAFTTAQALSGTALESGSWLQPHITQDSSRLFIVASEDTWSSNQLFEAWGDAVSVSEVQQNNGALCWPMPASDDLNVLLPEAGGSCTVQLFDASGRCVYVSTMQATGLVTIDVRSMPAGSYHLVIGDQQHWSRFAAQIVH